ncbi:hypothetical protein BST81_10040 [Leptolyngbya sp. 'hensonii']|uniref:ABC transporter ATP-binding protein n=1 Tax=Leptolyngbya sp. 'hensonii' TaxID=1922337 RepID=UPI00094F5858|nr:ABC transporter ATP-binding protein [Leptolyngbya sp. 'hensonii']OLP18617.1 hypothetical protein BST81_10040 [Leptolyngbya sp. 'hensonii']
MSEVVICAENLGKQYFLRRQHRSHDRLRDAIVAGVRSLWAPRTAAIAPEEFWALQDISFEVRQGEVIGIIGGNGAGKSTLLKILSQIIEPTTGRVTVTGRVASLLEVGTGFHPDLSGRENVFLNGAILGMGRSEIQRKFDEIVEFAGVSRFIDTPVKHYSSGMYVRLAFAVAAHLEPDLLIVDEVLAVGDAAFQQKCLGKMGEISQDEGKTVLFVSHSMGAVEALCSKALLLSGGKIQVYGDCHDVVLSYLEPIYQNKNREHRFSDCVRRGNGKVLITSFHLESPEGRTIEAVKSGDPVVFAFGFRNVSAHADEPCSFGFSIHVSAHMGQEMGLHYGCLSSYASHFSQIYFRDLPPEGVVRCLFSELTLAPNDYLIACYILVGDEEADRPQFPVPITVIPGDFYRTGQVAEKEVWGPNLIKGEWQMTSVARTPGSLTPTSGAGTEC